MESAAKQQAPKRTALIIEDNVMNREILTELLSDSFDVLEAENGMIGLETLHQHQRDISVILLDVEIVTVGILRIRKLGGLWIEGHGGFFLFIFIYL